jgi:hypothetical protein
MAERPSSGESGFHGASEALLRSPWIFRRTCESAPRRRAHFGIAYGLRVEIDTAELLRHLVQHAALREAADLSVEVEAFKDSAQARNPCGEGR